MRTEDVPWGRIVHFYGRASDVPSSIRQLATASHREAEEALLTNLEHQDGVIQATPYAVYFIIEALKGDRVRDRAAVEDILRRILESSRYKRRSRDSAGVPSLEALLASEELWPEFESEEEDEEIWEEWSPSESRSLSWAAVTERIIFESGLALSPPAGEREEPNREPAQSQVKKRWWSLWRS